MKKFFLVFLILYFSCAPQKERFKTSQEIPKEFSKIIERIPLSLVSSSEILYFDFAFEIPEAKMMNEVNVRDVFSFKPDINGSAWWFRKDLLAFKPFSPLRAGMVYNVKLKLSALSANFKDLPPLYFNFKVLENEILQINTNFEKDLTSIDEKAQILFSKFSFSKEDLNEEEIKRGIKVYLNDRDLSFSFKKLENLFYEIRSPFLTPENGGIITLKFLAKELYLSKDQVFSFPIAPLKKFSIEKVEAIWEGQEPKILINFSHPIKEEQDFKTFVRLSPDVELQFVPSGNQLKVFGNFNPSVNYKLTVNLGIESFSGEKIKDTIEQPIKFADFPPQLEIVESKVFLSSDRGRNLRFKTMNINQINLEVSYIPPQNIIYFLQDYRDNDYYDLYTMRRISKRIFNEKIPISAEKNKWIEQDLNLNFPKNLPDKGIFFVDFNFTREDTLWKCKKKKGEMEEEEDYGYYYDYGNYYSDPCSPGYYYKNGKKSVLVVISDISLLALKGEGKWNIWAYNVSKGEPEEGVEVEAYEYKKIFLGKKITNKNGFVEFEDEEISFLLGKKGENLTFLSTSSFSPPLEPFDLKGYNVFFSKGLRLYTYTERGVYRPSDEIHLTAILREGEKKPVDLPIKCIFENPLKQRVWEGVEKENINGVYYFNLKTDIDSPTGLWTASFYIGNEPIGYQTIKVEMVVPPKIKPEIKIDKEKFYPQDFPLDIELSSNYLFGAPASGLTFSLKAKLEARVLSFREWNNFIFSTPFQKFEREEKIYEGILNEEGKAQAKWEYKLKERDFPPLIQGDLLLEVNEKGGRPAYDKKTLSLYPYNYFIGAKIDREDAYKRGDLVKIPIILVDKDGKPAPEREMVAKIYYNNYHWWWEYRDYKEIISSYNSQLISTIPFKSQKEPKTLEIPIDKDYGSYFVEIKDKDEGSTLFFSIPIRYWAERKEEVGGNYLKYDGLKDKYSVGEGVNLRFFTPSEGTFFYAIVKGNKILDWKNEKLKDNQTYVSFKLTEDMAPNIYLFASAVQKIRAKNDRTLRAYSILPINVNPKNSKISLKISCPNSVKPMEKFKVNVKLQNKKEAVITLAMVDVGLLNLTNEKTPDPFSYFYQKIGWNMKFLDTFDYFYGINEIPAQYIYKVGGEGAGVGKLTSPIKSNPFPPVVFFQKPIYVKGEEEIEVPVPNYLGEVKVYAVATWDGAYGSAEKYVKVIDEIISLATFPRALSPGDEFEVPLQLFIQKGKKGKIKVELETSEHFDVLKEKAIEIPYERGEKILYFYLRAREDKFGEGNVKFSILGDKNYEVSQIIPIHPINPYQWKEEFYSLKADEEKEIPVNLFGFRESSNAQLTISAYENIPLKSLYDRIVSYPFGCIEQTSSKLFATLFLRDLVLSYGNIFPDLNLKHLDNILIAGFNRLQNFMLPEGNFSFWPSERYPASSWTNLYVAHLLVEASKRGFSIQSFVDKILSYEKIKAKLKIENTRIQAYRLYVLSLAGYPDFASMNLLKENYFPLMSPMDKLMLSSAYGLARDYTFSKEILRTLKLEDELNSSWEYFYNPLGKYGTFLYFLSKIDMDLATNYYSRVSGMKETKAYCSTHDIGWFLAGFSSYIGNLRNLENKINVSIIYSSGKEEKIEREKEIYTVNLRSEIGKKFKIKNLGTNTLFLNLTLSGIPLELPTKEEFRNIKLKTYFLDEKGSYIDEKKLKAGAIVYERIEIMMLNPEKYIAISQILPAGLEPINLRLLGLSLPQWASDVTKPSYLDIRDDRVNIFIDNAYGDTYSFIISLKVVTKGKFVFPPSYTEAMYNPEFFALLPHNYFINIE